MPKRPYPRHQRRHTALLIAALENPAQTQKQIAKTTGYSESHVSRIMCSPDFLAMHSTFCGRPQRTLDPNG